MKAKAMMVLLIIFFGTFTQGFAGPAYDLTGDWDAVITWEAPMETKTIKDIVKISQKGDEFVGIKTIGGKWVGKNEEIVKGKLLNKIVGEAFISAADSVTFELFWNEGRAIITEKGKKLVMQSYVPRYSMLITITLTRKS